METLPTAATQPFSNLNALTPLWRAPTGLPLALLTGTRLQDLLLVMNLTTMRNIHGLEVHFLYRCF